MKGDSLAPRASPADNDDATLQHPAGYDPTRKFVRVNGQRNGLVDFDFGIGDLSLSVEMLLPPDDFRKFCADQGAILITAEREAPLNDGAVAMSWRPSDVQHLIEQHSSHKGDE